MRNLSGWFVEDSLKMQRSKFEQKMREEIGLINFTVFEKNGVMDFIIPS